MDAKIRQQLHEHEQQQQVQTNQLQQNQYQKAVPKSQMVGAITYDTTVSVQTINSSVFCQAVADHRVTGHTDASMSPRSPRVLQLENDGRATSKELARE